MAGSEISGNVDGIGTMALLGGVSHIAVDSDGNVYVPDAFNHNIRKITPSGVVSTFAGSTQGNADGVGIAAQFGEPSGVAVDRFDNVYVTDPVNYNIRKITPGGVVTTLAGSKEGDADGIGAEAQFNNPLGIAVDGAGNVFVTDTSNFKIKKITPDGMVRTLAGTGVAGNTDGLGTAAQFNCPIGIAVDAAGTLYVTETLNAQKIRKITSTGIVSTLAGNGVAGFADGQGTAAQFSFPIGIAFDATGNLYIGDLLNKKIRKMTPLGEVSTFAGSTYGSIDGPVTTALFKAPRGIAIDDAGNIYVGDEYRVRKITLNAQSNRVAVTIIVNTTSPPIASAQSFCKTATITDLVATGSALQWFDVAIGGTALASTTILATGTYYVSQTIGCESSRTAVAVTITPSTTNTTTASVCDTYFWSLNGTTYNTSGTYTFVNGCATETLDLTIMPKTTHTTTAAACDSYIWSLNGETYTQSGNYTFVEGCHTETLALTITVTPIATVSLISAPGESAKLSADQMGTSYQWIDCDNGNTPIFGEINQSFSPAVVGTYSVIVTIGTCAINSDCTVVSRLKVDGFDTNTFNYYPNPVKDYLNFSYSKVITSVKVFSLIGQTLLNKSINATTAHIEMSSFPVGTYFVEVKSLDSYKTIKVIKK